MSAQLHSIVSLKFLEKLSASVFCVPGMCAADTHIFCDVHHTHSSFAILLQNSDLIPPLLFTYLHIYIFPICETPS